MTGARHTWIKRVHGAQDFERFFGTRQRRFQQRCLVRTMSAGSVPRARIPRGRNDGLVILDLSVANHHPVRQRAARGFVRGKL